MNDRTLQYFMSLISPPEGEKALAAYLRAIARALQYRTDADLGRVLGVSGTSIANWKRRGRIPAEISQLLRSLLVEKIATYGRELPSVSLSARELVIQHLSETECNPLNAPQDVLAKTAQALPGLLSLAQLLIDLQQQKDTDEPPQLVELMKAAMIQFRNGDQLR